MASRPISVVLIDDHQILRDALRAFVAECDDIDVVGEAASAEEGVAVVALLRPDVVVLDIRLPGRSGLDAAREIRRHVPDSRILVLTAYDSPQYVRSIIEVGAYGYLLKSVARQDVVDAIRAVARGETVLHAAVGQSVVQAFRQRGAGQPASLTIRETEVLQLLGEGKRNRDIAADLHVENSTVESHVRGILRKLDATNRTQAVRKARQQGYLVDEA